MLTLISCNKEGKENKDSKNANGNKIVQSEKETNEKLNDSNVEVIGERKIIGWISADEYISLKLAKDTGKGDVLKTNYVPSIYNTKTNLEKTFIEAKVGGNYTLSPNGKSLLFSLSTNSNKEEIKSLAIRSGIITELNYKTNMRLSKDNFIWIDDNKLITRGNEKGKYSIINLSGEVLSSFSLDEGISISRGQVKDNILYFTDIFYSSSKPIGRLYKMNLADNSVKLLYKKENGDFNFTVGENIYVVNKDTANQQLEVLNLEGQSKGVIPISGILEMEVELVGLKDSNKCIFTNDNKLVEADCDKLELRTLANGTRLLPALAYDSWSNSIAAINQDYSSPNPTTYIINLESLLTTVKISADNSLLEKREAALRLLKDKFNDKYLGFSEGQGKYIDDGFYFVFRAETKSEMPDTFYIDIDKNKIYKAVYKNDKMSLVPVD
jgi:hypothetical protein